MAKYAVTLGAAAGPATEEIADISATTTARRVHVYDFVLASSGTPADTGFIWIVQRSTAHGTRGGAVVPAPLDAANAACVADAGQGTYTIATTLTAATELLDMALNLRATFRWVAAPGGEMTIPATDNAGLVWICNHASATDAQKVTVHFDE